MPEYCKIWFVLCEENHRWIELLLLVVNINNSKRRQRRYHNNSRKEAAHVRIARKRSRPTQVDAQINQ